MIARDRTAAVTGAVTGWCLAMTPGALPRTAVLSAVAGSLVAVFGLLLGLAAARLVRWRRDMAPAAHPIRALPVAGRVGGLLGAVLGTLALTVTWQDGLRAAMGMPPIGPGWIATTVAVPAAVVGAIVWMPFSRRIFLVAASAVVALGTVDSSPAAAAPDIPHTPALLYSALERSRGGPTDDDSRAAALVNRWMHAGGADHRAVVIAVPTGSGWVDAAAVTGFERRFAGSVRVLAVQYSEVPSWQAYVRSPDRAGTSATALLRAVDRALSSRPRHARPAVYLYGQSLGAVGAEQARRWARQHGVDLAGTVLSGVPGGGSDSGDTRRVVINNPSDPVAALRLSLLWRPPYTGRLPWVPGLPMLATTIDLAGSLDVPTGYGHRYGAEQGLRAPQPSIGPRTAS